MRQSCASSLTCQCRHNYDHLSHEKHPLTFHYTCCLIGILLVMDYYHPHKNWVRCHPLYTLSPKQPFGPLKLHTRALFCIAHTSISTSPQKPNMASPLKMMQQPSLKKWSFGRLITVPSSSSLKGSVQFSCKMALRLSPKPGALIAATCHGFPLLKVGKPGDQDFQVVRPWQKKITCFFWREISQLF